MVEEELKPKKQLAKKPNTVNWGPWVAVGMVIVVYLASQLLAAFVISLYPVLKHWSHNQANTWLNNSVYAQFWVTLIIEATALFLIYLFLKQRKSNFKAIGVKKHPKLMDIAYIFAGFLVYIVIYYIAIIVVQKLIPNLNISEKQDIGFSTSTSGFPLVLVFLSVVIFPPIVEEILFRGVLYSGLKTKLKMIYAALITSAIFASLHLLEGTSGLLWVAGIDTFILSMVLVYLREKTGKLWASMGLHMLKNAVAFAGLFLFHLT